MDFAKHQFKKYNADIETIAAKVDGCKLEKETFDCVVTDTVLEHVLNIEEMVKVICDSLKPGGSLYLLFDSTFDERFPMHISAHFDMNAALAENGLKRVQQFVWKKEGQ